MNFFVLFFVNVQNKGIFKSSYHYGKLFILFWVYAHLYEKFTFKGHKYKPKKLLKIDGLLIFYYLILPKLQKNTKEYGLWVIFFMCCFVNHYSLHSPFGQWRFVIRWYVIFIWMYLGGLYNSAFQFYKGGNFVINASSYIKMALGTSPKWLLHNTKMAKYV
jgi:hypothetical protein